MSVRHGTIGGYTNHGCRCTACTEALRVSHATWKANAPEPNRHDFSTYVNYGCRCPQCRESHTVYQAVLRGRARARLAPKDGDR